MDFDFQNKPDYLMKEASVKVSIKRIHKFVEEHPDVQYSPEKITVLEVLGLSFFAVNEIAADKMMRLGKFSGSLSKETKKVESVLKESLAEMCMSPKMLEGIQFQILALIKKGRKAGKNFTPLELDLINYIETIIATRKKYYPRIKYDLP